MGFGMNARGGTEIIIATMGLSIGLVSQQLYSLIVIMAVVTLLLAVPSGIWAIARCKPDDEPENPAMPLYVYDEAIAEPAEALNLVEQEQLRLAQRLPAYSEAMRSGPGSAERQLAGLIHEPFAAVSLSVDRFMRTLVSQSLGSEDSERLTVLQSRLGLLSALEQCLNDLSRTTRDVRPDEPLGQTVSTFVEGLDFLLHSMLDALTLKNEEGLTTFLELTGERCELLESIRKKYMSPDMNFSAPEKAVLFHMISGFHQALWLLNRTARLLAPTGLQGAVLA
jgi:phosphate:Na+ symporter